MGIKAALSKPYARYLVAKINRWKNNPVEAQRNDFQKLIEGAGDTAFGKDHGFSNIRSYEDFRAQVPVRDYEGLRPYVDRIIRGEKDVLWQGTPIYLSKTSGTTSGTKYIPITQASIHNHINSAKFALLSYIHETGKANFVNGKMIFLQGSPELTKTGGIPTGRLSGIVAHHVPGYLQKNRMPSYATNCIDEWEAKLDAIVRETIKENMTLISGIPSWVQMYFERLIEVSGKKNIKEIFPDFSLFVYGGVNYGPYRAIFDRLIGGQVDSIETYPASEGFIAFQDSQKEEGLLLVLNSGIFYEFIPVDEIGNDNPTRIPLEDVETGVNYAIILNTNAGMWGYNIGDTVKFVSKNPYRLIVTGRIKHFTSAFGEHVIAEEAESSMKKALEKFGGEVSEFHVAPYVDPPEGVLPYHEWFVEFNKEPDNMKDFRAFLDQQMQEKNIYYKDLISGNILQPLKVTKVQKGGFVQFMKARGKLGGQNKVPRLSNDRKIAGELEKWKEA